MVGDVRSAQAHSRHQNLATLIRYDDGRQQLQGKAGEDSSRCDFGARDGLDDMETDRLSRS